LNDVEAIIANMVKEGMYVMIERRIYILELTYDTEVGGSDS
jgi:hypothetical protein